ncbi:MAG: hypothetical protein ABI548_11295, partial [Polyangiaceae bacterium]
GRSPGVPSTMKRASLGAQFFLTRTIKRRGCSRLECCNEHRKVGSQANPQNVGSWTVGSSTAPDPYYNAFWAAERLWRNVLSLVGSATVNFTGIQVRGFANNIPGFLGSQPTSAADGPTKRVQLDANAGFSPQARIVHELGHIQNYVANPFKFSGSYSWDGNSGWGYTTPEFGSVAFEEGFATHYGNIEFWYDNSVTPTSCLTSGTCYDSFGVPFTGTDIEATSYPYSTNNCNTLATAPESRWPISAMRFFWDVFDNHNDADGDTYSANNGDFWQHLAMLAFYPQGTGGNQINDPWNAGLTSVTEPDGRGSASYAYNYVNSAGLQSIDLLRTDNCGPF